MFSLWVAEHVFAEMQSIVSPKVTFVLDAEARSDDGTSIARDCEVALRIDGASFVV